MKAEQPVGAAGFADGSGRLVLYANGRLRVLDRNGKVVGVGTSPNAGDLVSDHTQIDLEKNHAADVLVAKTGHGYWIATNRGDVHSFGGAPYHKNFQNDCRVDQGLELVRLVLDDQTGYKAYRSDGQIMTPR